LISLYKKGIISNMIYIEDVRISKTINDYYWISFWLRVVSHIPKFGDASKSPSGDTASPAGDASSLSGDAHPPHLHPHLPWEM
jgi:hypothetical protein